MHNRLAELPGLVAGVDEVGRGPLAGPVCAAAVIPGSMDIAGLVDSKRLRPQARALAARRIRTQALCWGLGWTSVEEIDRLNVLQASLLAMRRAIESLPITPLLIAVDGNRKPDVDLPIRCVVGGDNRYAAIAAASIIAKVARDRYMQLAALGYPCYGFARHKGYGSALHLCALNRYGASIIHRRSFAPVARVIAKR